MSHFTPPGPARFHPPDFTFHTPDFLFPCLRAKRWRTKEKRSRAPAQREGGKEGAQHSPRKTLYLEALKNPALTPPLLEDVEEAEGHDVHLVAGEGPGVFGRGEEAHDTLGYRGATAQGTPDSHLHAVRTSLPRSPHPT